jgi:hypothetical protein
MGADYQMVISGAMIRAKKEVQKYFLRTSEIPLRTIIIYV